MLTNIKIGRYYRTDSFVHSLNCFTKILLLILYCVVICIVNKVWFTLIIFLFTLIYLIKTNVPFEYYLKSIYDIKFLLLFIIFINIVFGSTISFIILSILKIILLLLFSLSFIYTTSIDDMFEGFYRFLSPLKLFKKDIKNIVIILTASIKFIPILIEKFNLSMESLLIRGVDIKRVSIKDKFYLYKELIINLFKKALKKADSISNSLILRNYNLNYNNKLVLNVEDYLIIDIFLSLLLGVLICAI